MPVQVRNLVAEHFVIQLQGLKTLVHGPGQQAHLFQEGLPFLVVEVVQFRGVPASHEDTVALVILPRTEESHRVGEVPENLVRRQLHSPKSLRHKEHSE